MHDKVISFIPIAKQCARNFCYKRITLDPDEIEAEAYFILCLIFLDNYTIEGKTFETDEDLTKHVKSRIYRDLGTYIRPTQAKAKTWSIDTLITVKDGEDNYHKLKHPEPTTDFLLPLFEIIEGLVETELEMRVMNCYLKGITDDHEIRDIVKVNVQKVATIRVTLVDRMCKIKTRGYKNEIRRNVGRNIEGVENAK